ncbi:hypothetical protein RO3G_07005 [Lichtheimia corymbifera JMRC:FSU:9682]|uniref:N-acetyltransferase domain-containing protein n=1 Tax=Lichtheimia corymbifera JMRC:FSU:9682 TaxID=1263082 RepID=A0A068S0T6_9FUNG|nr:hypothetical protein RO3G_07005 [Lichtheimia corymbifera JMRC:FSU:9682]
MALVAPPTAFDERRISRKLTINIDQHEVNVRPIIKGAIKEAAHTLTESSEAPNYDHMYTLFKDMVNTASIQSRDFAVQVDGCKGVLVWTNHHQGFPFPIVSKQSSPSGFIKVLRSTVNKAHSSIASSIDKTRRKVMSKYSQYITIGYIGVLPHEQRKGLGSALLHYVTDKADEAQQPICAQVACSGKAVRFFEKFGFKVEATVKGAEVPACIMVREPVAISAVPEPRPLRIRPGRRISDY